jgi:outer membrane lipoprotein SlyB
MRSKLFAIATILVLTAFVVSCASVPEQHKGAAVGAGAGAATGAVAGAVLGDTRGAVVGGLLGALVGGAIGHYGHDQRSTRAETVQKYNYQPSAGTQVKIEEAAANPQTVSPGQSVDLKMSYAVLTPSQDTQVNVTETREIRMGNEVVGKPQVSVMRTGGTYSSNVPLTLPATAQKGTYTVISTVQAGGSTDTRQSTFTVS